VCGYCTCTAGYSKCCNHVIALNHVIASKPWITNELKELMAERDYALRVAKRSGNQEQWNEYRRLKNFTNRKIKSTEALHYKNLIESENPKDVALAKLRDWLK